MRTLQVTFSANSFVENNKANSFQNILLDNMEMSINVSVLSTLKALTLRRLGKGDSKNVISREKERERERERERE